MVPPDEAVGTKRADGAAADTRSAGDGRRDQMLVAAAELIAERGFGGTRVADVAKRVGTSPALVMYYFATKDELLIAALRHSEAAFYHAAEDLLSRPATTAERLRVLVDLTFESKSKEEFAGPWGLWFELWNQAFRNPEVAEDRRALDEQWRDLIARVVEAGRRAGEITSAKGGVDTQSFALEWAALLDGLSVQVALDDPVVTAERAREVALGFAHRELGI